MATKESIKLMADYSAHPLWRMDDKEEYSIDPKKLSLSGDLIDKLNRWASVYNATLNQDDPSSSGFSSIAAEENFEQEGIGLWKELQMEIGHEYRVWYFSEKQRRLMENIE